MTQVLLLHQLRFDLLIDAPQPARAVLHPRPARAAARHVRRAVRHRRGRGRRPAGRRQPRVRARDHGPRRPHVVVPGARRCRSSSQREAGILKRRRATPVPAAILVISRALTVTISSVAACALLVLVASRRLRDRPAPRRPAARAARRARRLALLRLLRLRDRRRRRPARSRRSRCMQAILLPLQMISGIYFADVGAADVAGSTSRPRSRSRTSRTRCSTRGSRRARPSPGAISACWRCGRPARRTSPRGASAGCRTANQIVAGLFPLKDNIPTLRFPAVTVALIALNVALVLLLAEGRAVARDARRRAITYATWWTTRRSPTRSPIPASRSASPAARRRRRRPG